MKITDPDVIKNGEKDLIQAVKDDLDLDTIKKIMQNKINAETLSSKGGEIVVHNNEIAFRLDFSIEISSSLMFDRQGNYIPESDETDDLDNAVSGDSDSEEELNINLPDYDLEDGLDLEDKEVDTDDVDALASESDVEDTLPIDDLDPLTNEPDIEPDSETNIEDELDPEPEQISSSDPESETGLDTESEPESVSGIEENDLVQDDIVDEDIDDILKESRDFWEEKKDE